MRSECATLKFSDRMHWMPHAAFRMQAADHQFRNQEISMPEWSFSKVNLSTFGECEQRSAAAASNAERFRQERSIETCVCVCGILQGPIEIQEGPRTRSGELP